MSKNQKYEPELKEKIIRLHLEEGRIKKSLTEEYNLGRGPLLTGYNNVAKNAYLIQQLKMKMMLTKK